MKVATTLAALLSLSTFVSAQISYNSATNAITCPASGGNFCAGASLSSNIIIRCSGTVGQPGNCNDNLAGVSGGVNYSPCYQSSPTAGDAACSYNGIVYPDNGAPFPIPGSNSTNTTTTTTSRNATTTTASGSPTPYNNATTYYPPSHCPTCKPSTAPVAPTTVNGVVVTPTVLTTVNGVVVTPATPTTAGPVLYTGAAAVAKQFAGAMGAVGMAAAAVILI